MANTYLTGNPVGSTDPRDLCDNASNLDDLLLGAAPSYPDRLLAGRVSWAGMESSFAADQADREAQFNAFLDASGFENPPLVYVDGTPLQVDRVTQLIERSGGLYTVRRPAEFPFTLTGTWTTDQVNLVLRNDQGIRNDLLAPTGASLVRHQLMTLDKIFGAVRWVDNYADIQSAIDDAAAANAVLIVTPGATGERAIPSTGLVVKCPIRHMGTVIWNGSACSPTSDGFTFFKTNSVVSKIGFFGDNWTIDMHGAGRDCIHLQKFEGANISKGHMINVNRAALNVQPINDFDWMENLTVDYLKVSGCTNYLRGYIPNKVGVFANLFTFTQAELRACSGRPIDITFDGTTSRGQSMAEWSWLVSEFDTLQAATDPGAVSELFYCQRINEATFGACQSWTISVIVPENTLATNPKIHENGFHCSGSTNLWGGLDIRTCDPFNVTSVVSSVVRADSRLRYNQSGRIDTSSTGNYSSIMNGGYFFDRILIRDSFQINAGATVDFLGPVSFSNIQRMVTTFPTGDSFYTAGEVKNVFTIGTDVGVGSYEVHDIDILSANANTTTRSKWEILYAGGVTTVTNLRSPTAAGEFTLGVSGGFVTVTNTSASGKTVRVVRTKRI